MPGSLLLSHDAYSDVSEASGRSLDSKIGGKKVSFNNAVRVKQYPWKPDFELNRADHLTLPSNRFWFKVYKNKQDSPISYNSSENSFKTNSWAEENMECIHDSLAPIAEVEDQDLDVIQPGLKATASNQRNYCDRNPDSKDYTAINNSDDSYYYHPVEPPVDYFEEMHLDSSRPYDRSKTRGKSAGMNGDHYNYNSNYVSNSNLRNFCVYGAREIPEEPEENIEENHFLDGGDNLPHMLKLPRMVIQNDSPLRRSVRRLDYSDALKKRERRSRSHDDYLDNDGRFKQLKKADKSVSTEDLNFSRDNSIISNRFVRGSRDMATQCYGTLNRGESVPVAEKISSSYIQKKESERLNNFRSPISSRKTFGVEGFKSYVKAGLVKKESQEDEISKRIRPYHDYQTKSNLMSCETNLNYKKFDSQINDKVSNGMNRILSRNENITPAPMQRQNGKTYKAHLRTTDFQTSPLTNGEYRKPRENNSNKMSPNSATVGYLRGRQIPLSEVNTNTSRKFLSKNENGITNRNRLSQKINENVTSPNRVIKADLQNTNDIYSRKSLSSNLENNNGKNHKNGSQKTYASVNGDNDTSMIDWSLSGFQLASKPDNGITSVSDSEYTVHRRPPLLMYIPGVSHHDRPALEDDRLSALSDVSRSEMNDGLSSLASSSKGKNSSNDIRRRHSMPRGEKLKWIKWKNKG